MASSRARRTASFRRLTASFRRMLRTWVRTVLTETNIAAPISSVDKSSDMRRSTSISRSLSGSVVTGPGDGDLVGRSSPAGAGRRLTTFDEEGRSQLADALSVAFARSKPRSCDVESMNGRRIRSGSASCNASWIAGTARVTSPRSRWPYARSIQASTTASNGAA